MMPATAAVRALPAASSGGAPSAEVIVLAVAVVLIVALVLVRAWRAHDLKRRKAAGSGYYDSDAARFGPGGTTGRTVEHPPAELPSLAPSFSGAAEGPVVAKAKLVLPPMDQPAPSGSKDGPSSALPLLVQPPPPGAEDT
jgi:hypothetical protein